MFNLSIHQGSAIKTRVTHPLTPTNQAKSVKLVVSTRKKTEMHTASEGVIQCSPRESHLVIFNGSDDVCPLPPTVILPQAASLEKVTQKYTVTHWGELLAKK